MTKLTAPLLIVALFALSACNTAVGLGRDTIGVGRFVANQVFDDE